jgi:glycosyltransferase involved in cell wall biosynthesis
VRILEVCAIGSTAEILLLPLIDRLVADGHHVDVACSPDESTARLKFRGYDVHEIPIARRIAPAANIVSIIKLRHLMRREHYDVVHVHTPVAGMLGRIAARIAGVRCIVYTAHGFYFHDAMPRRQYWLFARLERWAGQHCTDYIFVQSREDYASAVKLDIIRQDHLLWIGNGVDTLRFCPLSPSARAAVREKLGIADSALVVVFVGRLVAEKGLLELLEAWATLFARVPGACLLLVGIRPSSEREDHLQSVIDEVLCTSTDRGVRLLGNRNDVEQLLAASDVFVLPSYREGMPRSVIEAMACALPVVATSIRGCREEVVDRTTGLLVPPRDAAALGEALELLARDVEMRGAMGRAGRARAVAEFDENLVLERQLSFLTQRGALARPEGGSQ